MRPSNPGSLPMNYAELESLWEKEKARNRKLTQQLSRARAEVVALKTDQAGPAHIPAAVLGKVEPGAHNIPHRLTHATNKRSTKCPVCQQNIGFMAPAQVCRDCCVSVHGGCSSSLPPTCGLPTGMLAALSA